MAPFKDGNRGRRTARGSGGASSWSGRSGVRNGKGPRANTERNAFYLARVEEKPQEAKNEGQQHEGKHESGKGDDQPIEASETDSDDDDHGLSVAPTKSYSSLLQSLSASTQRYEPKRKRKKLKGFETTVTNKLSDEDVEDIEEPDIGVEFEVDAEGDLDELDDSKEPFAKQFSNWDESSLGRAIEDLGIAKITGAKTTKQEGWLTSYEGPSNSTQFLSTGSRFASIDVEGLHLKQKLKDPLSKLLPQFDVVEASVATAVFHYQDVLFPQRTLDHADTLRKLSCLHSLNHVLKTRDKIIKNNARISRSDADEDLELRDQGFTRPKVLILLPTRHSCVRYVDTIISLCEPEQQENKKRFHDSYANGEDNFSSEKPADFQELFAGNDDDMFRLGLKFTRKTIKYFSRFYSSDIILASPIGLRMALGGDDPKKQDNDFLSSIEICILDQADAIAMQNWEHIEYIFEHLNLQPKETHGCDFSRVRHWYLDGQSKHLRQTILLSAFNFPALNKMYAKSLLNVAGKIKYGKELEGAIVDIGLSSKQTFSRFDYQTPASEPDDRFKLQSLTSSPGRVP